MSLSAEEIATMLQDYENDWHTGMSALLHEYTSEYPFLVSRLCELMAQDKISSWNERTFQNAVREMLRTPNTLFEDMGKKLEDAFFDVLKAHY